VNEVKKLIQEAINNQISNVWLTIPEAAVYLKMSESTLRKKIQSNKIPYKRTGESKKSNIRFSRKQLDLWLFFGYKPTYSQPERKKIGELVYN